MTDTSIYSTIAKRTGGDIYIGVVGPVRTGKSTFIHKFLDAVIIPGIESEYDKERTRDEIPQSGSGKTITTTEPKFVPGEAVRVKVGSTELNAKMIDCVGYMVEGAVGAMEDGAERMVMTPWSKEPMPFTKAAEIGTERVVKEHSTIAMLVTTDGSFGDIPRESFLEAERRVVSELTAAGKPFAIILNSQSPDTPEAHRLAEELEGEYSAPVALVNCTKINEEDARGILELVVGEFPVKELIFDLPSWIGLLDEDHPLRRRTMENITEISAKIKKLSQVDSLSEEMSLTVSKDAACGCCCFDMNISKEEYFKTLSELAMIPLYDERSLMSSIIELSEAKREYDRIKDALRDAKESGYGIVMPKEEDLTISEPTLIKQGSGYGVKVTASAESIHMIKTSIKADVCPALGNEAQSEEVMKAMVTDYEEDPKKLLNSKVFGRSLYDLVSDGMNAKLLHMPLDSREKLGQTLEKIINEGAGGLICVLL